MSVSPLASDFARPSQVSTVRSSTARPRRVRQILRRADGRSRRSFRGRAGTGRRRNAAAGRPRRPTWRTPARARQAGYARKVSTTSFAERVWWPASAERSEVRARSCGLRRCRAARQLDMAQRELRQPLARLRHHLRGAPGDAAEQRAGAAAAARPACSRRRSPGRTPRRASLSAAPRRAGRPHRDRARRCRSAARARCVRSARSNARCMRTPRSPSPCSVSSMSCAARESRERRMRGVGVAAQRRPVRCRRRRRCAIVDSSRRSASRAAPSAPSAGTAASSRSPAPAPSRTR